MIRKRLLVLGLCLCLFSSGVMAEELEKEIIVQGIKCAKGHVDFYESGKLESACFPEDEDQEIQGMRFLKGTRFTLYESGEFLYAYSFEEQEIQGIKFPEGTHLCFYESGKLQYVDIHQDQEIQGIKFLKGTHLGSGKLRKLAEEILKRKINWKNKIKTGLWIILIIGVILAIRGIIPQIILTQIRKLRKQERK